METEPTLVASKRTELGTAGCRRLRRQGIVPGNVYGHRQEPVAIAVSEERLESLVHGGNKVVDVEIDGGRDKAMFRDVQWDPFGVRIQHFDLIRIAADERVTVDVPIELRGVAPGVVAGGVLEQQQRTLMIDCLVYQIPEFITVRIGELEIGDVVHVGDVELPENATSHLPPETMIVQVTQPVEAVEAEEEEVPGAAEPEVISRKEEGEAEE